MENEELRMQNALFLIYTHDDVFPVSVGTPYMASAHRDTGFRYHI